MIPPFGFSITNDPLFCSPNQVIPQNPPIKSLNLLGQNGRRVTKVYRCRDTFSNKCAEGPAPGFYRIWRPAPYWPL